MIFLANIILDQRLFGIIKDGQIHKKICSHPIKLFTFILNQINIHLTPFIKIIQNQQILIKSYKKEQEMTFKGDLILDPFCGSGTTLVAAKLLGRNYIGIDLSEDAVTISQQRVNDPIKTNSNLLLKGREFYNNSDETLLSLLLGLEYYPVQRNQGIDAILKQDLDGSPITIRIQRPHKTITEAALNLYKASQNKNVKIMFLIALTKQEYLEQIIKIPPEVIIINAPSLVIKNTLDNLANKSFDLACIE